MLRRPENAAHFVDAVYRRMIILRVAEQIGRGFLIASVLAIGLIAIAIWQTMPTEPILLLCGCLGLLIGLALTIHHWPTRLAAATETDRQLRLDDLLTTALSSTNLLNDEFARAVSAMADARCNSHHPSEVLLHQYGIRAWSGLGLAMAIAVTLAVIPLAPSPSQAIDANTSVLSSNTMESSGANVMQQGLGAITSGRDPISENSWNISSPIDAGGANPLANPKSSSGNGGNGSDSSVTNTASQKKSQKIVARSHDPNENGITGSGGAASIQQPSNGKHAGGTESPSLRSQAQSSKWTGNESPPSQKTIAIPDDNIPPEYRDLIRAYFHQN